MNLEQRVARLEDIEANLSHLRTAEDWRIDAIRIGAGIRIRTP